MMYYRKEVINWFPFLLEMGQEVRGIDYSRGDLNWILVGKEFNCKDSLSREVVEPSSLNIFHNTLDKGF